MKMTWSSQRTGSHVLIRERWSGENESTSEASRRNIACEQASRTKLGETRRLVLTTRATQTCACSQANLILSASLFLPRWQWSAKSCSGSGRLRWNFASVKHDLLFSFIWRLAIPPCTFCYWYEYLQNVSVSSGFWAKVELLKPASNKNNNNTEDCKLIAIFCAHHLKVSLLIT